VDDHRDGDGARLQPLLARLRGADPEAREIAADEIEALARAGISVREALILVDEAAERFPPRRFEIQDTASDLLRSASHQPDPLLVPAVTRNYRRYGPKARVAALDLLAQIDDAAAAEAILGLLRANARSGRVRTLPVHTLLDRPKFADIYFPELLQWLEVPDLTWPICELCLGWIDRGAISPAAIAPHAALILRVYAPRRDRLIELEGKPPRDDDAWGLLRREAGLLLDLLGHVPTPQVQAELRRALALKDVRVKFFAVVALLRHARTVLPDDLEEIAASAEMRRWFWEALEREGRTTYFPWRWRKVEAFAESDLVRWLAWPAELGQVPDEIELADVVSVCPVETVQLDWYVFKFRLSEPHWAAKEGWIAGVAGPYVHGAEPGSPSLGDAFTRFEAYSRRTPAGHVGDLDQLAMEWRERLEALNPDASND
jgi:hypothetical protein